MSEFRAWQVSDVNVGSKERLLWLRGTLGVGKSTMAGYFIDLLKCLYPKSVAYFFCKSGQLGLISASDIIQGFRIDENIGIRYLFEKLISEPLLETKHEVYFVLDGLDEASMETKDLIDPKNRSQMDILIECLANLESARVLFISRPNADISRLVPNSITRSIINENMNDITTYIRQTVNASERLINHFRNAQIDPLSYFAENANGIFLWVVLVLQQLLKAKSTATFRTYLNGFSEASGDMERLYLGILEKIEIADRCWVKEILRWVAVEDRTTYNISVDVLQEMVEWALDDTMPEFVRFLEVECGSIMRIVRDYPQLIHETARTFLFNSAVCPPDFWVDQGEVHSYIATLSLDVLINSPHPVASHSKQYAITHWTLHVGQASLNTKPALGLLIKIHEFFESNSIKSWIRGSMLSTASNDDLEPLYINVEERHLRTVRHFLKRTAAFCADQEDAVVELMRQSRCGQTTIDWMRSVLEATTCKLGEILGKASAEMWLVEELNDKELDRVFRLALKYYCASHGRSMDDIQFLKIVGTDNFACLQGWVPSLHQHSVKRKNLGYGMLRLCRWKDAIICYGHSLSQIYLPPSLLQGLGIFYLKTRSYSRAISILQESTVSGTKAVGSWQYLVEAFHLTGNYQGLIHTLEGGIQSTLLRGLEWSGITELESRFHRRVLLVMVGKAYRARKEYDKEIESYERAVRFCPTEWWAWQYLGDAYVAKGDIRNAVEGYERAGRKNPNEQWPVAALRSAELNYRHIESGQGDTYGQIGMKLTITNGRLIAEADWFVVHNKTLPRPVNVSLLHTFEHSNIIDSVAFSPDGNALATSCYEANQIFDLRTGLKIATFHDDKSDLSLPHCRGRICFSQDGRYLLSGGTSDDGIVRIWDTTTNCLKTRLIGHSDAITSICTSNNGHHFFTGSVDKTMRIWELESGVTTGKIHLEGGVHSLALSFDGKMLAIAMNHIQYLQLFNIVTGAVVRCNEPFHPDGDIVFSPCSYELCFSTCDTVHLWRLTLPDRAAAEDVYDESERDIIMMTIEMETIRCVGLNLRPIWSSDGKFLICGGNDGKVEFFGRDDGLPRLSLCGHSEPGKFSLTLSLTLCLVLSVAQTQIPGNLFATGGRDFIARVWSYEFKER